MLRPITAQRATHLERPSQTGRPGVASESGDLTLARLTRNHLLASLPTPELTDVWPRLELVRLEARDTLFDPEQPIPYVYFPETAVVSLVSLLEDGGTV